MSAIVFECTSGGGFGRTVIIPVPGRIAGGVLGNPERAMRRMQFGKSPVLRGRPRTESRN